VGGSQCVMEVCVASEPRVEDWMKELARTIVARYQGDHIYEQVELGLPVVEQIIARAYAGRSDGAQKEKENDQR
jgi:hypothetical protein